MKLYDSQVAPNPRRVRIFLAEKGIEVPTEQVDLAKAENRAGPFLTKNPMGAVPVLELDDGTYLAESLAICEYFEELHPDPPLFGSTAQERALTRMWERRMEQQIMRNLLGAFVHTSPFFEGRVIQVPAYAEACRETGAEKLAWLDGELAGRDFVAGDRFSVADITLWCTLDFADMVGEKYDPDTLANVARWHASMKARPTAGA